MKARKGMAAAGLMAAAFLVGLGLAWNAGLFSGAATAAAAENAAMREAAARRAEQLAFTEVYLRHETKEMRVASGETLAGLLTRAGASSSDASAALNSIADVYNPRRLRPGQAISLYFQRDEGEAQLTGVAFRSEPGASVTANRTTTGGFEAREVQMPLTFEIARIAAPVETSLYSSALTLGATDREVAALADAFSYDVDFQRDVRPGDNFELVFERFYDDEGNTVRTGDLLFVSLESSRGSREFYQFMAPGDSRPDWYDAEGKSARRFLMKTPINGARLSSGFGMRRHPILGYSRMHRGTDFAAPTGTAILAAGDGVVERAGPFSSFGNYVRIRHANGYETAYAHMSRFARGMRAGARVRQGQVIGYVGTTGRSTGPHLHYEVLRRGQQVNPMSLRVANGRNLTGRALELFMIERERINTLRQVRARENPVHEAVARPISASGSASQ
ncbi:MAG: peptidoglycan DD-metalloendopeptidase family protein [Alphaproteobacteria bacterium]|nr:peptidoglycan DD-metalloendopeptidase family protein [Alphaproteobacteria bacterium]